MSYTVRPVPTTTKVVANPGIRAVLTARAEIQAHAERVAEQRQADRDHKISEALAAIAKVIV